MVKGKVKRQSLFLSVLSLVLCVAMLAGTTFAWFTDTAGSSNNKIVSGNLAIEVEYRDYSVDEDAPEAWKDITEAEDGDLFYTDGSPWEPGKVVYQEFRIKNIGSLAAKYQVDIGVDSNVVIEKREDGWYYTDRTLGDKVLCAVYQGDYDDFITKAPKDATSSEPRDIVAENAYLEGDDALDEIETITTELEFKNFWGSVYYDEDMGTAYEGVYESVLLPHSELVEIDGKFVKPTDDIRYKGNDNIEHTKNCSDEETFTIFAYWWPNLDWEDESMADFAYVGYEDNDYNLNNGVKKASADSLSDFPGGEVDTENPYPFEALEIDPAGLKIDFRIIVTATQVPYESDSFDEKYDYDVEYNHEDKGPQEPGLEPKQ